MWLCGLTGFIVDCVPACGFWIVVCVCCFVCFAVSRLVDLVALADLLACCKLEFGCL